MVAGPSRGLVPIVQNQNSCLIGCGYVHRTRNGPDKAHCRKCQISTATPAKLGACYEALGQEYLDVVRPKHDLMFRCQIVIRYQNVSHIKRGHRYHGVSTELCVVGHDDDLT